MKISFEHTGPTAIENGKRVLTVGFGYAALDSGDRGERGDPLLAVVDEDHPTRITPENELTAAKIILNILLAGCPTEKEAGRRA